MRKILCMLLALVLLMLSGCGGQVGDVKLELEESPRHSEGEIQAAMEEVKRQFARGFDGCVLLELCYREELSAAQEAGWEEQYDAGEVIVLKSTFRVEEDYTGGPLEPGETYENYSWVLAKTLLGWEIKTNGYG